MAAEDFFNLSQMILDEVNCSILAALAQEDRTASDIVKQLRLPMTTCYRRLNWLAEKGLVRESLRQPKGRGGPYRIYTSLLKSLTLRYECSSVELDLVLVDDPDRPLTFHQQYRQADLLKLGAG